MTAFTLASTLFEIPTSVGADTGGRRVSLLLCLVTLFVTTLLYVGIAWRGWGFWPLAWVSVLLGLGYTFYTGAVDAWLVDALKATGYDRSLEPVFARGQMLFGAGMLVGTIGGGLLGQIHLYIPYFVRAAVVVPLFLLAWFHMPELGYTPRTLELGRVPAEMRRGFVEGMRYRLAHPGVRAGMLASLVSLSFLIFCFYSSQRVFLDLLGQNLLWAGGGVSSRAGGGGASGAGGAPRGGRRPGGGGRWGARSCSSTGRSSGGCGATPGGRTPSPRGPGCVLPPAVALRGARPPQMPAIAPQVSAV